MNILRQFSLVTQTQYGTLHPELPLVQRYATTLGDGKLPGKASSSTRRLLLAMCHLTLAPFSFVHPFSWLLSCSLYFLTEAADDQANIAMAFAPLMLSRHRMDKVLPMCAQFKLLQMIQKFRYDNSLREIDALLCCPMWLFPQDVVQNSESLTPEANDVVLHTLFVAVNWLREVRMPVRGTSSHRCRLTTSCSDILVPSSLFCFHAAHQCVRVAARTRFASNDL